MRVLVLPKWYPWPDRPVFGLFCREHARAEPPRRHQPDDILRIRRPHAVRNRKRMEIEHPEPARFGRIAPGGQRGSFGCARMAMGEPFP